MTSVEKDLLIEKIDIFLMDASRGGYPETVKALISAGANPNIQDEEGRTALMIAS